MEAADASSGWRGTPERPHLARKALATTLISALIFAGMYVVISHETWLSFRSGWLALPDE